ncbi:MAG: zinc dependent phospholipase C family protein [Saccharofermentanales bacterium]
MTLFTHLLLSGYVYQKMTKESRVKWLPFMIGSVRPDLTPDFLRIPHTLSGSGQQTNALYQELLTGSEQSTGFSQTLGILTHYLSDYFCLSHQSEERYTRLFQHFIHERALFIKMLWMVLTHQEPSVDNVRRPSAFLDEMIGTIQNEYSVQKESIRKDLDFAVQASLWVCRSALCFSVQQDKLQNVGQLAKSVS